MSVSVTFFESLLYSKQNGAVKLQMGPLSYVVAKDSKADI